MDYWDDRDRRIRRAGVWFRSSESPEWQFFPPATKMVAIGERPGPAQIRNSNSYSLAAQVQSAGGEPEMLAIAPRRADADCGL